MSRSFSTMKVLKDSLVVTDSKKLQGLVRLIQCKRVLSMTLSDVLY